MRSEVFISWRQVFGLTAWSLLVLLPLLLTVGPHVCAVTFSEGATRLWSGVSPYLPPERGDVFHYSPLFAFLYRPLVFLPFKLHAIVWAATNALVFWAGVSAWFRLPRRSEWPQWIGWILCSMELDISLRYQQTNAMMAGFCLLALAALRHGWLAKAGFWIAVGANLKFIPGVFALALVVPFRKRGVFALVVSSIALASIPAIAVGPVRAFSLISEQWHAIASDLTTRKMLEITAVFERIGFAEAGKTVWWIVACATAILFPLVRLLKTDEEDFPYLDWYGLILMAALLLIARTESPTFVWMAPLYLALSVGQPKRVAAAAWTCGFFISFVYTSLYPSALRFVWQDNWSTKALGVLALWTLVAIRLSFVVTRRLAPSARIVAAAGILPTAAHGSRR